MPYLLLILLLCLTATATAASNPDTRAALRQTFLAAEQALQQGQRGRYLKLRRQLQNYPLLPYLQYRDLRRRLARAPRREIEGFLHDHEAMPLADRLRHAWIRMLARHGRWQELLAAYRPSQNTELQCLYRRALYKAGRRREALADLERLWLVGHSQPRACDPLFKAWQEQGALTPARVWQRFGLAMNNGQLRLARYLRRFLPTGERRWADLWISVYRRPDRVAETAHFPATHHLSTVILSYGIRRLADHNPQRALMLWEEKLGPRYAFTKQQRLGVERHLAIALAVRGDPEALARLAGVDEQGDDTSIRTWRIRAALSQGNWYAVLAWIYQLTPEEQLEAPWQYWQGRALEALGQRREAESFYLALAGRRSYYGLLAADRLALPYHLDAPASTEHRDAVLKVEEYPGLLRARELFALGRIVEARREWYYATRDMAEWQLQGAARLAHAWGWHDRAIVTMARTRHRDDLALRFPLVHREQVLSLAEANDVDPAFAFALIRQESAFTPDARSSAGALGLMQLLPRTARQVAGRMGLRLNHRLALLDVDTNLRLGMAHLGTLSRRFSNHPVLTAAAYNAGPYRVDKWIQRDQVIPADIWLETLPIAETRGYVRNVLLFTAIYEHRLGRAPRTLQQRMRPITPPGLRLARAP